MQPKYKIIHKTDAGIFLTYEVKTLNFLVNKNLPVIIASYSAVEGGEVQTAIIDEVNNYLYQATNAFDKVGKLIYHGNLFKDAQGTLFEVMYAVGSYFIVKDDIAVMLLDDLTRKLEVVGNIVENYDLIKVDTSVLTDNQ